ncbi:MAG: tRNA lysidine(34) synthetase TilS, partial [Candidatus Hydrogenedentes bacterium]|nr:tRNA lysidine(34) synthetase TilS [Candidatus Hydrogenedentota bacterium]
MRDPIREKVRAYIAQEGLLEPGQGVVAAVSGGADSVALLLLLLEFGYTASVAHFDHQTRGGESAADLEFVRELAARLGTSFHSTTAPVAAMAEAAGESFETCARRLRYAWLADIARETGFHTVATGHHLDDQAETALMRIVRGTGVAGLGGIQPLRDEGRMRIVRPLLCCRREEIAAWLEGRGQAWRTDASNSDTHYLRNRIRHGLLPLLRAEFNNNIEETLARLTDNARADNVLLDQLAAEGWRRCVSDAGGLDREAFRREPGAIQRRIAAAYIAGAGGEAAQDHVLATVRLACNGATGTLIDIGGGRQLHAGRHTL